MAWRPTEYLIEGELDNTTPGKVTGYMRFMGLHQRVRFELEGNFHRDIRGAKIKLTGDGMNCDLATAKEYMHGFALKQNGKVGDITAGKPPADYVEYPYIEWYSDNGRCCIELDPEQVQIIGTPIPACESDPVSRAEQAQNMTNYMREMVGGTGVTGIVVGMPTPAPKKRRRRKPQAD